ncbi:MAG TPA: Ser-Thr-rich GPI-anchored membrane family protein [Candidatus Lokiarchaeia archaeon]|nr:Ser-Thr-rich GPI-anchored membrane family protein [Candidatus Lokiarchaeia archaeon]
MERKKACFVISSLILACLLSITLNKGNFCQKVENTLGNAIMSSSAPAAYITINNPINLSQWVAGTTDDIAWFSSGTSGFVNIDYYYGGSYFVIAQNVADTESYSWTLPLSLSSGSYQIYIEDVSNSSINATSASFKIISAIPGFDVAFTVLGFFGGSFGIILTILRKRQLYD